VSECKQSKSLESFQVLNIGYVIHNPICCQKARITLTSLLNIPNNTTKQSTNMSAQRKLISVLRPITRATTRQITPLPLRQARSITTTSTLFRPAAKTVAESGKKEEDKTVPSEQITEEAKAAEPDAEEQVKEVCLQSHCTKGLTGRWRRRVWTPSQPRLRE
jgi:hypothetical protein